MTDTRLQIDRVDSHRAKVDRPRMVLHIGSGKCGSSAIQSFLATNASALREDGVVIPGVDLDLTSHQRGNQLRLFNYGMGTDGFEEEVTSKLTELGRQMDTNGWHTLIISAENLVNPRGFHQLFAPSASNFDISVVAYVRRQDDLMVSAWQQWHLKRFESFEAYADKVRGSLDWHKRLEPWRVTYGDDALSVRVFARDRLTRGDVVADFAHQAGLDVDRYQAVAAANRTLHERFNRLANTYRDVLFESPHDHRFYTFLEELLGEKAYKDYPGSILLTLGQRQAIVDQYAEANERLRRQYFPELPDDHGVFAPPSESDVAQLEDVGQEYSSDEVHDMAYVAMYEMYKRLSRLERLVESRSGG